MPAIAQNDVVIPPRDSENEATIQATLRTHRGRLAEIAVIAHVEGRSVNEILDGFLGFALKKHYQQRGATPPPDPVAECVRVTGKPPPGLIIRSRAKPAEPEKKKRRK